jgi:hypothetical protein
MRLAKSLCILLLAAGPVHAAANSDYWQENHCTRAVPEPALVKKGVKGHTFRIVKRRGEALETALIGDDRITIIHFGCEGVGWTIRTRLRSEPAAMSAAGAYDQARKLLQNIGPKATDQTQFSAVASALEARTAPAGSAPQLAERLIVTSGDIPTSVTVDVAGEGKESWLTVMIYTGPL